MVAHECAGERVVVRLDDDAFPDPLPELRLRRPELFHVPAHDERGAFLLLLSFLLRWH